MTNMINLGLRPETLRVGGKTKSLCIYFREGVKIKEAARFIWNGRRVLVYIGADAIPTAMQFVDPVERSGDSTVSWPEAQLYLFGIACKMVAFREAQHQRLGDALIQDAQERVEQSDRDACSAA